MKSFTKKLVLNCTGVIFISFLIVYFLFNAMVSSYIRGEAERELLGGITGAAGLAEAIQISFTTSPMETPMELHTLPFVTIAYTNTQPTPPPKNITRLFPFFQVGRFYQATDFEITRRITTDDMMFDLIFETPVYGLQHTEGVPWVTASNLTVEGFVSGFRGVRPVAQRASIVTTDMIMIDNNDNIITPALDYLPPSQRVQVEFLADYFRANRGQFTNNQMQRVHSTNGAFYVTAESRRFLDGELSTLMYTDISSAMDFTNSMNRILGALLITSGLLSIIISIMMSAKFNRAITRLCNHAETIGRGNFGARVGEFKDAEFARLSDSMFSMANMLQAYENNQKQFFQNVSHELRTPLMSIQGYAVGITRNVFSKEEAADIILSESEKMALLVDELLYISRMDNITEEKTTIELNQLLQECCERIKPLAKEKQIILTTLEKIQISAVEEKLERAILNILSNAARYAKSKITVSLTEKTITISDDGNGIADKDLPHIFERFYKGEDGNHGLGLAISKDIIKSHGGKIQAHNNNGAVFTISF